MVRTRLVFCLIPVAFGLTLVALLYFLSRRPETWFDVRHWLPAGEWPVFGDLEMTLDHLADAHSGSDPLSNPNSWYAYTRAFLQFHWLGVHLVSGRFWALLQSTVFVGAMVWLLRPASVRASAATCVLFITPPIVLALERANLDCALFVALVVAGEIWVRARTTRQLAGAVLIVFVATLLKVYPLFALLGGVFAERERDRRLIWLLAILGVSVVWSFQSDDFAAIALKLPVFEWSSFGSVLFFRRLERYLLGKPESYVWLANATWPIIAVTIFVGLALAAFYWGTRCSAPHRASSRSRALFWLGAPLCCGCFLGANIGYRWVFAFLAVPLLVESAVQCTGMLRWWGVWTLTSLAISIAAPIDGLPQVAFAAVQFCNWWFMLSLGFGLGVLFAQRSHTESEWVEDCAAVSLATPS